MKYVFVALCFCLIGCGPEIYFEQNQEIDGPWHYDSPLTYTFEISDTTQIYNLEFDLTHADTYGYQNVYVNIKTIYPDDSVVEDIVSLQMADKLGQFYGKCSGEKCTVPIMLQEGFRFSQIGSHTIEIYQHSRDEKLEDIISAKLKLVLPKQ